MHPQRFMSARRVLVLEEHAFDWIVFESRRHPLARSGGHRSVSCRGFRSRSRCRFRSVLRHGNLRREGQEDGNGKHREEIVCPLQAMSQNHQSDAFRFVTV